MHIANRPVPRQTSRRVSNFFASETEVIVFTQIWRQVECIQRVIARKVFFLFSALPSIQNTTGFAEQRAEFLTYNECLKSVLRGIHHVAADRPSERKSSSVWSVIVEKVSYCRTVKSIVAHEADDDARGNLSGVEFLYHRTRNRQGLAHQAIYRTFCRKIFQRFGMCQQQG